VVVLKYVSNLGGLYVVPSRILNWMSGCVNQVGSEGQVAGQLNQLEFQVGVECS